jgi:RNA polymerase sigma factor (sigma-70 family)
MVATVGEFAALVDRSPDDEDAARLACACAAVAARSVRFPRKVDWTRDDLAQQCVLVLYEGKSVRRCRPEVLLTAWLAGVARRLVADRLRMVKRRTLRERESLLRREDDLRGVLEERGHVLTPVERKVCEALAAGASQREVARQLGVSRRAVRAAMARAAKRLRVDHGPGRRRERLGRDSLDFAPSATSDPGFRLVEFFSLGWKARHLAQVFGLTPEAVRQRIARFRRRHSRGSGGDPVTRAPT